MSTASKVVLTISVVLTVSSVAGVHLKQAWDRERLREGVLRDLDRLQRKQQNLLEEQKVLTRQLEEERRGQEARLRPQDT
ncbi:protein PET117 homolog, mitochondrial [Gambusia affinis]|uniref:protein PET117 homolog, mitochondrial n=1 Tax=Gambusia affinis TaxID=33528 RepID=UPI001CDD420E|nr:protein PET117 homolog, mitochondrial [Gambusia affinis]